MNLIQKMGCVLWIAIKFTGRWIGPAFFLLALWFLVFPYFPFGDTARLPVIAGTMLSGIAWFAGRKSERRTNRLILACCTVIGLCYWSWSNWNESQGYTIETVSFENEGATLVGTLYLPDRAEKVPGLVFLPGSGAFPGSLLKPFAAHCAQNGIAVLTYDKRGVGKSTGIREARFFTDVHRNMEPLASDAAMALTLMQSRPEIESNKVGIGGISEGGLLAPVAAAINGNAAFMLNITTTTRSLYDITAHQLSRAGHSEASIAEFNSWYISNFNPMPSLASLDIPGLWILAGQDTLVPNEATMVDLYTLKQSGKPYNYVVYPDSWHGMFFAPSRQARELIDSWLMQVTSQNTVNATNQGDEQRTSHLMWLETGGDFDIASEWDITITKLLPPLNTGKS